MSYVAARLCLNSCFFLARSSSKIAEAIRLQRCSGIFNNFIILFKVSRLFGLLSQNSSPSKYGISSSSAVEFSEWRSSSSMTSEFRQYNRMLLQTWFLPPPPPPVEVFASQSYLRFLCRLKLSFLAKSSPHRWHLNIFYVNCSAVEW